MRKKSRGRLENGGVGSVEGGLIKAEKREMETVKWLGPSVTVAACIASRSPYMLLRGEP